MSKAKIVYAEPDDYFPKRIRKQCGLGEYAKPKTDKNAEKPAEKDKKKK